MFRPLFSNLPAPVTPLGDHTDRELWGHSTQLAECVLESGTASPELRFGELAEQPTTSYVGQEYLSLALTGKESIGHYGQDAEDAVGSFREPMCLRRLQATSGRG